MVLWFVFALLTCLALGAVMWPLLREKGWAADDEMTDADVYRDQLKEIEADLAQGLLAPREAEAARLEVSRRLLAASRAGKSASGSSSKKKTRRTKGSAKPDAAVLTGVALALPLLSVGLYLLLGSPSLPGAPYQARLETAPEGRNIARLIAQVEERLRQAPQDGEGWNVIAPVYVRLGRYADGADAYRRATALLGETAKRLEGYGEARTLADNGIVNEAARKSFERALALDGARPKTRYWLGVALEQDGRTQEAVATWKKLLEGAAPGAPWRPLVEQRIANAVPGTAGQSVPRGPGAADIEAAAEMSQTDRAAMINQMVAGLAQRLNEDGSDLQGWLRLTRAYMVLQKPDAARDALARARKSMAGDSAALAQLDALAQELKL
jgi:cytochrome c-type biogenesis protein CcmH